MDHDKKEEEEGDEGGDIENHLLFIVSPTPFHIQMRIIKITKYLRLLIIEESHGAFQMMQQRKELHLGQLLLTER